MKTLDYLQFFEGLAEKLEGTFSMSKTSSKSGKITEIGDIATHFCDFKSNELDVVTFGLSRKDALKSLYRKLQKFK